MKHCYSAHLSSCCAASKAEVKDLCQQTPVVEYKRKKDRHYLPYGMTVYLLHASKLQSTLFP